MIFNMKGVTVILILFFVTGGLINNENIVLSFKEYNNSAYPQKTNFEFVQTDFISISNQPQQASATEPIDNDSAINNFSNSMTTTGSEFVQDVDNQYSNPKYGIGFDIPNGWSAAESMNGDKGIIITMHPGTSDELYTLLGSPSNNQTIPIIQLIVQDKKDLREKQISSQSVTESSLTNQCNELRPNSTAIIDNKSFQISTMKCSTSDSSPIPGIDFSSTEIVSMYRYDSPNIIYVLQLLLSSEYSPTGEVNSEDIVKFQPVMDSIIQSMKIKG